MQTKEYFGIFYLALLHEELCAVPGMTKTNDAGFTEAGWTATYEETKLTINIPNEVALAAVDAVIAAHDPSKKTPRETALAQILQLAQSAAGVRLQDLTAAQIKALLAILLYKVGAVDAGTLTVRPLKEWV